MAEEHEGGALLDTWEAAQRLGVSPYTVRRWISFKFIASVRTPTGNRRITEAEVERVRAERASGWW